jgi:hypothetical protein
LEKYMSAQTDELDNIIASLTNINAALKAQEANVLIAPEVPAEGTPETPEVPAEQAEVPSDPNVAPNTPSAQV